MAAPADEIWNLVADIRTGCEVPRARQAQRDRADLLDDRPVHNWHYAFAPLGDGTDVTESFWMPESTFTKLFGWFGGQLRTRRNIRDMTKTLNKIKAEIESAYGWAFDDVRRAAARLA